MLKNNLIFTGLLLTIIYFSSCKKDDPIIPDEQEVITTLNYTLTPTGGGTPVILSFVDLDGDGGNAPVITGGSLAANQTYTGAIEMLNETETPAENITEEIEAENKDHQFFFQTTITDLSISYSDQDADGNPVGLSTMVTAGAPSTGTLTVILRHEPNKTASGVSDGNINNAGGETDIEVSFPVDIQ